MKLDPRLVSGLGLSRSTVKTAFDLSKSSEERLHIVRLLREIDAPERIRLGSVLIKDPDPLVRCEVVRNLGSLGPPRARHSYEKLASETVGYLFRLALDKDWRVRRDVAFAALRLGWKMTFPIIKNLLNDQIPEVRSAALRAYVGMRTFHPNAAAKLGTIQLHSCDFLPVEASSIEPDEISLENVAFEESTVQREDIGHDIAVAERPPVERQRYGVQRIDIGHGIVVGGYIPSRTKVLSDLFTAEPGEVSVEDLGGGAATPPPEPPKVGTGEPEYITPSGPPRRYVNSWFVGHSNPLDPLSYGKEYELGIQVGPQLRVGSMTAGDTEFTEPPGNEETIELAVAIVTDDFEVLDKPAKRMKLPRDITKWSSIVTFKVKPVKNNQDVFIHVLFYTQNNLFQEALIGARVQIVKPVESEGPTSYFPAQSRVQVSPARGPRDVNLQIVRIKDTYRFVLFHDFGDNNFDVVWCTLPINHEKLMSLIQGVSKDITAIVKKEGKLLDGTHGLVFYDGEPQAAALSEKRLPKLLRVDDDTYKHAVTLLAETGSNLFVSLFFSGAGSRREQDQRARVGARLRELSRARELKIQVLSDEFFIPWNLFYDGDFDTNEYSPAHFWGFKHVIEEVPATIYEGVGSDHTIALADSSLSIGMNINQTAIPAVLSTPQLDLIHSLEPSVTVHERFNEQDVLSSLQGKTPQGLFEYFYCHAGVEGEPQQNFDQSYIGLTSSTTGLTLKDIKLKAIGARFGGNPVVFLNACESVRMDGRFYDGFVPKFLMLGAQSVVGSDCELPSLFGAHFGSDFIKGFLKGQSIGEVLLAERRKFLSNYQNPLGLIYRVFGNVDARLSRPLV